MLDPERPPRPLRWYEWLALLLFAGYAAGARAAAIYQCTDGRGAVSFQDRPCVAASTQSVVAPAPTPAYAASPEYATGRGSDARGAGRASPKRTPPRHAESVGASSYECRTADGQVFYRHSACPRSVAAADQGKSVHLGRAAGAKGTTARSVAVTSTRISREEACHELRRAGAAGRSGRSHDQDVSTYDKNLGRDPCR